MMRCYVMFFYVEASDEKSMFLKFLIEFDLKDQEIVNCYDHIRGIIGKEQAILQVEKQEQCNYKGNVFSNLR